LYHRAQFEFFLDARQAGALPVRPDELETAMTRLDGALDGAAADFCERLAPAISHVWSTEVESLRADLRGWLQQAVIDGGWTPAWFELAFGLPEASGHDPASAADPVAVLDGALLRGSIDLVEEHPSGVLRITDHKTGGVPQPLPQIVGRGEVLQPVLYSLAAESVLGKSVVTGRLYYSTLRRNYKTIDIPISDVARARAAQVLRTIDSAIHRGFLPAAPREDACKRCDYLPVCGPYEEERVRGKPAVELKSLRDVRRLP
jgi:hypothetical protein